MKKITLGAIVALFILIMVSACKKDDAPHDILTGASCWKLVKQEYRKFAADPWVAGISIVSCKADNCLSFADDNTFVDDQGTISCDSTDQQNTTSSYTLSEDGTTLSLPLYGFPLTTTVEELTSSKLVFTFSFMGQNRFTFEAQ